MYTFRKSERLGNFRLRKLLFSKGSSFYHYPFRLIYLCMPLDDLDALFPEQKSLPGGSSFPYPVRCLISASKKQHPGAVSRNIAKRKVKEIYRKNKSIVYTFLEENKHICILAFIYTAPTIMPYAQLEKEMIACLLRLKEGLAEQIQMR